MYAKCTRARVYSIYIEELCSRKGPCGLGEFLFPKLIRQNVNVWPYRRYYYLLHEFVQL